MKLEKLYNKLNKKFDKYYKRSYRFGGSINSFTWDPYLGLENDTHQEIIVKLISKSNKEDLRKFIEDLKKHLEILEEFDEKTSFMIPTVFGTPEEMKKSHEILEKIAKTIPIPNTEKLLKESKPSEPEFRIGGQYWIQKEKEPTDNKKLMETAKTTEIILIFNNGHKHILEPEKYKVVSKVDLETWKNITRDICKQMKGCIPDNGAWEWFREKQSGLIQDMKKYFKETEK